MAPNDRELGALAAQIEHQGEKLDQIIERLDIGAQRFDEHADRISAIERRHELEDALQAQRTRWAEKIGSSVLIAAGAAGSYFAQYVPDLVRAALARLP